MSKPILFIYIVLFLSCRNNQKASFVSAATQKNLDAQAGIDQAFASKNFSKLSDYISADCINHSGAHGDVKGVDSMIAGLEKWTAIADEKSEVVKLLADDEYSMMWEDLTGKYKVAFEGHQAGETYKIQTIEVKKFKDGKVIEHWEFLQQADAMKMMSADPSGTKK